MCISSYIADVLGANGFVDKKDVDICRYGLEVFFASVFDVMSVLVLSIFLHNFLNTILFFVSFLPLRVYAGGYHADTKSRCFLIMLFVYAVFTIILKFVLSNYFIYLEFLTMIIASAMVLCFAPIIHRNKSSNINERRLYRKLSVIILLVQLIVITFGIIINHMDEYLLSFALGQLAVSLSMIAALVKTKIQRR